MLKNLVYLVLVFVASVGNAADTPYDKLLKASKLLVVNSADRQSFDVLKENLNSYEELTVKASLIKVMSLALLNSDESKFEAFKTGISAKYPWMDFSFAEENSGDYEDALKRSVNTLALNASSAFATQTGNAPAALMVNPRQDAIEAFSSEGSVEVETEIVEKDPVVEDKKDNNTEIAKVNTQEVVRDDSDIKEAMKEAAKTKSTDVDKESIYYKVYNAALAAQKGEGTGIRELMQLTFEEKPEEMTSAIVKAITLGMLNANSKSTNPYIIKVNSTYLDNAFLNFLDEEPISVTCRTCQGKGYTERKCRESLDGKCRNCKGEGTISYRGLGGEFVQKTCPTCKGTKVCNKCDGTGVIKKTCPTCKSKGKVFNRGALKDEFTKALQYVIDLTPKLADEADVYIGVGVNNVALARVNEIREVKRAREAEEKARMKAEREAELAKLEAEREAELAKAEEERNEPKVKEVKQGGQTVIITEFETTDGESNENLDYAVLEFDNFYKVQQKRTGSSIYEKVHAKYESGRAILYMDISDEFQNSGKGYKEQILDGCYQFFKLRAGANGAGGSVDVKMMHNGKVVAGTKSGETFFN